ncbi:hypothetical protein ACP275_05G110400 [Erythranthe tilingii]
MEAFALLKYWRPIGGGDATHLTGDTAFNPRATRNTATAVPFSEEDPYFDLEFTPPTDYDIGEAAGDSPAETESGSSTAAAADELSDHESSDEDEEEDEVKYAITSDESNVIISPSSIINISEENSKLPASLLKSATKFRVLLLKLKKTKSFNRSEEKTGVGNNNLFLEFDVDEDKGPLISLFARDNNTKDLSNERNLVQKYLKMIKPKVKFSGEATAGGRSSDGAGGVSQLPEAGSNVKSHHQKRAVEVVRKHLGKSRSSSAMLAAAPPPGGMGSERRRDDSLLQQEDGIQGAILHCKRSFNATRDGESVSLSRSVSDPS